MIPTVSHSRAAARPVRLTHDVHEIVIIPSSPTLRANLATEEEVLMVEQVARLDGPVYVGAFYYVARATDGTSSSIGSAGPIRFPQDFGRSLPATHGVDIGRVEVTIEAIACDARTARLLEIDVGSPILLRERLVRDANGIPVSLSYVHFSAGRVALATATDHADTPPGAIGSS